MAYYQWDRYQNIDDAVPIAFSEERHGPFWQDYSHMKCVKRPLFG